MTVVLHVPSLMTEKGNLNVNHVATRSDSLLNKTDMSYYPPAGASPHPPRAVYFLLGSPGPIHFVQISNFLVFTRRISRENA